VLDERYRVRFEEGSGLRYGEVYSIREGDGETLGDLLDWCIVEPVDE
jgi:hypothetical protein